jgi:hypothetical protein
MPDYPQLTRAEWRAVYRDWRTNPVTKGYR